MEAAAPVGAGCTLGAADSYPVGEGCRGRLGRTVAGGSMANRGSKAKMRSVSARMVGPTSSVMLGYCASAAEALAQYSARTEKACARNQARRCLASGSWMGPQKIIPVLLALSPGMSCSRCTCSMTEGGGGGGGTRGGEGKAMTARKGRGRGHYPWARSWRGATAVAEQKMLMT